MLQRDFALGIICTQFLVHDEVAVVFHICVVLRAVVLVITCGLVRALDKQMVCICAFTCLEQLIKRLLRASRRCRISIHQIC